jgi:tryptophan synthase alpha chain
MSRYTEMFAKLSRHDEVAFVPFLVLGDPDVDTSCELVRALVRGGADALELGIPFSDPVADGPVIQAAATRALSGGTRTRDAWFILRTIRAEYPDIPIGLLVYANLVLHRTAEEFYASARDAGVDSVLVADLPLREAATVDCVAALHGIAPVHIAPPNADAERISAIAGASRGYVYVTSRPGVTGIDDRLHTESAALIAQLRRCGAPPALLGFGISRPEHVAMARQLGAAGAISGSAVVRQVERNIGSQSAMIAGVQSLVRLMKGASRTKAG